ncbi:MAG TPA: hypothetical protein VFZ89_13660, partial [Solirubrobacteraceae bacterium]
DLDGGAGNDVLKGDQGEDKLAGGAGDDVIKARQGGKDEITCGDGNDKVLADKGDTVAADCETVSVKGSAKPKPAKAAKPAKTKSDKHPTKA